MEKQKKIRITGLRRVSLHMGYYVFKGTKKNCFVHLFSRPGVAAYGQIGVNNGTGTNKNHPKLLEFTSLAQLKQILKTF